MLSPLKRNKEGMVKTATKNIEAQDTNMQEQMMVCGMGFDSQRMCTWAPVAYVISYCVC